MLGPSLVVLALVFSTGGVAIVGQAGSSADGKAEAQPSAAPSEQVAPAQAAPSECPAPASSRARLRSRGRSRTRRATVVALNTQRLQLHALEGEWRPEPTAKPSGVPEGVLPNDAVPPAAPAKAK